MPEKRSSASETIFTVSEEDYHERDNGICLACGEIRYGSTEPDACNYPCDACGENQVYGLEEALLMGRIIVGGE